METNERVSLPPELAQRVVRLTRQGKPFEAVREIRKATKLRLAEAKQLVEEISAASPPAEDVFGPPTAGREEAAAALAAVGEARAAGFTPFPGWFFPVLGLLLAGVLAVQAISPYWLGLPALALVIVAYVVVERVYARQVRRAGAAPRNLTPRQQLVLVAPLVAMWVAGGIVDARGVGGGGGGGLVWLVVGAASAAWTIGFGVVHNRRARASV